MSKCCICDGSHFTLRDGKNICDDCGTEQAGFIELQSQEVMRNVDRSRFVTLNQSQIEEDKKQDEVEPTSNWTTFEIFDLILSKWVSALNNLGASEKLKPVVAKLWMAYLQKLEVAFLPSGKKTKDGLLLNKRDREIMHSGAHSVKSSTFSRKIKKRKKKKKSSEEVQLDKQLKIKERIERKKLRKNKSTSDSNVYLNSFVIDTLSQSINDLETSSQISDESQFLGSIHSRKSSRIASKPSVTYTECLGSQSEDNGTLSDNCSEYAPSENDAKNLITSQPIKRTKMINNWLQQKSKVYEADSSSDEDAPLLSVPMSSAASGGWSSSRSARRYTSRNMSKDEVRYYKNNHPQHLNHPKLFCLLYLAILLTEEDILLSDLLRWIREGHLPYLSSHHLLSADLSVFLHDLSTTLTKLKVPTATEVRKNAGKLAVFLNLKTIPLPTVQQIISRYTKTLRLPDMVNSMAQMIATKLPMHESKNIENLAIPSHENEAAAYIIFVLKAMYGLDGKNEIILSEIADRFNKLFKNHECTVETGTLFSWSSWECFMNTVLWLSGQVDPACAQAQIGYYNLAKLDTETFSKFYWTEMIWKRSLTTRVPNEIEYEIIETLENGRNKTLDCLINQNKTIKGTKEPFFGSIQQYLKCCNGSEQNRELSKIALDILSTNYSSHVFDWHQNLEKLQYNINKCCTTIFLKGSSNILKSPEYRNETHSEKMNFGQQLQQLNTEIIIPQPYSQYKVEREYIHFENIKSTHFKWLISSIALLYELNTEELTKSVLFSTMTTGSTPNNETSPKKKGWPKGRKRRLLPKDNNAPKGPLSGYMLYMADQREIIRQTNAGALFHEITKMVAQSWSQLGAEEKQKYLDAAEIEKERYQRELEEYQKTDAYKKFMQSQNQEEVKEVKKAKKEKVEEFTKEEEEEEEEEEVEELVNPNSALEIPIFTEEFLNHNKGREAELRQLRKSNTEYEEQNAILQKHIESMKNTVERLEKESNQQRSNNSALQQHIQTLRRTLVKAFSNLPLPGSQESLNENTIDNYMVQLHSMIVNNPHQHQNLIQTVRSIVGGLALG